MSKTRKIFIFQRGEQRTIYPFLVKRLARQLKDSNFTLMFNTNHFHNVQFELREGSKINYPISITTLWTTNELIKNESVFKINIIPISKKEYDMLIRFS
jgi:hypothetical protein